MANPIPIVAIVGRTNVGKSTLFNAILGRREAVVQDEPGVTRDRHYVLVNRWERLFTLVDTGGLVGEDENPLQASVRQQSDIAIKEADVVLAVVDGLAGVHPQDRDVAEILRRYDDKVIWVVNKCEKGATKDDAVEFYEFAEPERLCFVSAAHRKGIRELVDCIKVRLGKAEEAPVAAPEPRIKIAVVGKPNVGKSSLINRILGEERLVTSPIAGTTRSAVNITFRRDGNLYEIVDTAGLRKRAKVEDESTERYSNLRALKALVGCDVAILVLDANEESPGEQEAKIASLIHERGRGFIIVVNKWDLVPQKSAKIAEQYEEYIREKLKFADYPPIVFVSALTGKRCPSIVDTVRRVYDNARKRVGTGELNRLLGRAFEKRPPPNYHGGPVRLLYATQVDVAPPTFTLFVNAPKHVNFSYERYIKNVIRMEFDFAGTDIRIFLRKRPPRGKKGPSKDSEETSVVEG